MQRSACHDPHVPVQFVYRGPAAWRCAGPPFAQERAARIREIQIARRVCAVGVRPLVAPSLGIRADIRANSGLSSGRCRARAPRGRVAGTYTGCTLVDATDGTRAMDAWRAWAPQLLVAMAASVGAGKLLQSMSGYTTVVLTN